MPEIEEHPKHWEAEFDDLPWVQYFKMPVSRECEFSLVLRGNVTEQALKKIIQILGVSLEDYQAEETTKSKEKADCSASNGLVPSTSA